MNVLLNVLNTYRRTRCSHERLMRFFLTKLTFDLVERDRLEEDFGYIKVYHAIFRSNKA